MSEEMRNEIFTRLDALAEKLGTTTEYLWGVLIKQAKVDAIEIIIMSSILLILGIIIIFIFKYLYTETEEDDTIAIGIIGFVLILAGIINLSRIPTRILNPDYWALQKVLDLF